MNRRVCVIIFLNILLCFFLLNGIFAQSNTDANSASSEPILVIYPPVNLSFKVDTDSRGNVVQEYAGDIIYDYVGEIVSNALHKYFRGLEGYFTTMDDNLLYNMRMEHIHHEDLRSPQQARKVAERINAHIMILGIFRMDDYGKFQYTGKVYEVQNLTPITEYTKQFTWDVSNYSNVDLMVEEFYNQFKEDFAALGIHHTGATASADHLEGEFEPTSVAVIRPSNIQGLTLVDDVDTLFPEKLANKLGASTTMDLQELEVSETKRAELNILPQELFVYPETCKELAEELGVEILFLSEYKVYNSKFWMEVRIYDINANQYVYHETRGNERGEILPVTLERFAELTFFEFFQANFPNRFEQEAHTLYKNKEYEMALKFYSILIKQNPDDAVVLARMGNIFDIGLEEPQLERALEYYTRAINKGFSEAWIFSSRASIRERKEQFQGAYEDYSRAIQLDNRNPDLLYFRGKLLYEKMNELEDAQEDFEDAARMYEDFGEAEYADECWAYFDEIEGKLTSED